MSRLARRTATALSIVIAVGSVVAVIAVPIPATSAPRALDPSEQLDVYRETIDARWAYVHETFPDAVRPPVYFKGEVPAIEYEERQKECLVEDGMKVIEVDGGWAASAVPPLGDADLEVAYWRCQSTYAYEGTLSTLMSVEQRNSLYDYAVDFLPACYAMLGIPAATVPPPDRTEFVAQSTQFAAWSPLFHINTVFDPDDPMQMQRDAICPPEPAWRTAMLRRSDS